MMNTPCQLLIFVFTCLVASANTYAQSPREQLNQMVEQLQKTPNDSTLREKTNADGSPVIEYRDSCGDTHACRRAKFILQP